MVWLLGGSASSIKVEGSIGMTVASLTRCRVAAGIHYCVENPEAALKAAPGEKVAADL
jgi:hypothetical protein